MLDMRKLTSEIQKIASENNFKLGKVIHKGLYYKAGNVRDVIFEGVYKEKTAILKIYDDPRLLCDGISQTEFNKHNKSKILRAPEVYAYKILSPNSGWLIMEKIPEDGEFFKSPLKPEERQKFLRLFLEYKNNSLENPTRVLNLAEKLPAHEYHSIRIARWFELATKAEAERICRGQKPLLTDNFISIYVKAMHTIREIFKHKQMEWCAHGHFVPNQVYRAGEKYYLTDFGHSKMYPEGYELSFIIWSDWLMHANWKMDINKWMKGINEWNNEIIKVFSISYQFLLIALLERLLGAVLADVCATDRMSRKEQERRITFACSAIEEII